MCSRHPHVVPPGPCSRNVGHAQMRRQLNRGLFCSAPIESGRSHRRVPHSGPAGSAQNSLLFCVAVRVVVDFKLCESNAVCVGVAPDIFQVREDDRLYVLEEHPSASLLLAVEDARRLCPKQAISIEES
jgi:ferredoxin